MTQSAQSRVCPACRQSDDNTVRGMRSLGRCTECFRPKPAPIEMRRYPRRCCEHCDVVLTPGAHDTPGKFSKRRYCSIQCCGKDRSAPLPSRSCPSCDKRIERREGEARSHFAKRVHCSKACAYASVGRRAHRIDIFGVMLTLAEVAFIVDVTKGCIEKRIEKGKAPLTGRKFNDFEGVKDDNISAPQGQVSPLTAKYRTQNARENNPKGGSR